MSRLAAAMAFLLWFHSTDGTKWNFPAALKDATACREAAEIIAPYAVKPVASYECIDLGE